MEKDNDRLTEFGPTSVEHKTANGSVEKSKEKKKKSRQERPEPLLKGLGALAEQSPPEQEKQSAPKVLKTPETNQELPSKSKNAALEIMGREELLEASEKIVVGATTLRQVFETHLISERGLRQAVDEYRRGGDIRRVLAEELLIKELGYELDPQLRDRRPSVTPTEDLMPKQLVSHPNALSPIPSSPSAPEITVTNFSQPSEPPVQRRVPTPLIIANVIALIVLAILLFVLIMIRI
jgi:hypothetical protein